MNEPLNVHLFSASGYASLLRETLEKSKILSLPIQGASMMPTLIPGSIIDVVPLRRAPRSGDIIVYLRQGHLITHRVIGHHPQGILTQGDANPYPDPPVPAHQIIGRVSRARYKGNLIWQETRFHFIWRLHHALRALRSACKRSADT